MAQIENYSFEEISRKQHVSPKNILNNLTGKEWISETCSVFYQKGLGLEHKDTKIELQHPAPFSFQDIGRFIRFFTKENDLVLDPFCGVASSLKACAILKRKGIGIELSKKWANLGNKRLKKEVSDNSAQRILIGDSRIVLKKLKSESVSYIVTSPPYWNILTKKTIPVKRKERAKIGLKTKYSESKEDLGNISNYEEFLSQLTVCFEECYRILQHKKHATIIVSDFRHKSEYVPFHSHIVDILTKTGFILQGITVLVQRSKKLYPYGYPYAYVQNIHHQYAIIVRKI
jgi:DNA modification methylase